MAGLDPDFTLLIDSANDLSSNMNVYAVAWVAGDPGNGNQKTKTPVVKDDGTNPKWQSHPIKFTVFEAPLLHKQLTLNIELVSESTLGDTTIGKVEIPLKELLDRLGGGDAQKKQIEHVSYSVRPKGTINFGYIFGNKFWVPEPQNKSREPVMASPVGYPGSSFGYPPASHAGAYPPAQAYSYPPPCAYPPPGSYPPPLHQQPGYGYAPPPQAGYGYGYYGYGYGYPPQPGYGHPVHPVRKLVRVVRGGSSIVGMIKDVVDMFAGGGFDLFY